MANLILPIVLTGTLSSQSSPEEKKIPPIPSEVLVSSWLAYKKPPTDCSIRTLFVENHDIKNLWVWPIGSKEPHRFGYQNEFEAPPWAYPPDSEISIFFVQGPWFLAHARKSGWAWILVRELELNENRKNLTLQTVDGLIVNCGAAQSWNIPQEKADKDGWSEYGTFDSILPLPDEPLMAAPSEAGPSKGPVKRTQLKILQFQGNWAQVQEAEMVAPVTRDDSGTGMLKIKWGKGRQGWVRWRVPGPFPGSWRVLMTRHFYGVYDYLIIGDPQPESQLPLIGQLRDL